jgi:phosphohistidine swiveling domain-containing protein
MKAQIIKNTLNIFFIVLSFHVFAQGPRLSYFHNPRTELSWASCYIHFDKGSKQKIGFFPTINEKTNCPMGIENYSKNIDIDKALVFLGVDLAGTFEQGQSIDIKDKIVMLNHSSNDKENTTLVTSFLEKKIKYAIENKAAGIVIVSNNNDNPLYIVNLDKEIPVITITKKTLLLILESAGVGYKEIAPSKSDDKISDQTELPVKLKLKIDGKFKCIETAKFKYNYLPDLITEAEINQQMKINEQSVEFLLKLFKELDLEWNKENIYYFSNYDSKIFYTGYWGIGFSCDAGVYNVFFNKDASYSLSVHENTHSLLRKNSLTFSSFFDEGIARYAEAMATNKHLNNKKTIEFLRNQKLFSLEKMLDFNIGKNKEETEMGYPASGSFVEFLIEKYGLKIILRLNSKASNQISKKELISLEEEWLKCLRRKYK